MPVFCSRTLILLVFLGLNALLIPSSISLAAEQVPQKKPLNKPQNVSHGIAMHGQLKYQPGFKNFEYTNPSAPKGGKLNLGIQGTFTSLNPLNIRGGSGAGVRAYLYESLLGRALDEPFSLYGLIAEYVDVPDDRSSITFFLNKNAKFSDGKAITVEDVIFSHTLLKETGRPNHRSYYSKVKTVETIGKNGVKFTFDADGDREMPLIMGLMPILPKHAMNKDVFQKTNLKPPLGSGPYIITKIDPGKLIVYQRNPDYWGKNLPVNTGRYNFNEIKFIYFRDSNTIFEAFKKGLHDIQYENDPGKWSSSYNFNAIKDGRVLKREFSLQIPSGMSALVFNTRRPQFKDQNVRKALIHMFNFEDINRKLYHGLYSRTFSYFDRSILSSIGRKPGEVELSILPKQFQADHPELFEGTTTLPKNRSKGIDRRNVRAAIKLLKKAGYKLSNGKLVNVETGKEFSFEILTVTKSQEALLLNFIENLKLVGIKAVIRQVDSTQYQKRKTSFDFDMMQNNWSGSLSPGNEQLFRWSSKHANIEGSYNFAGIKDPRVDQAIQAMLAAKDPKSFTSSVRSLDRLLLSGDYVIPLFHLKGQWLAHRAYLGQPELVSFYGALLDNWWDKRVKPQ